MVQGYKELIVWQKAMTLVQEVYRITNSFPKEEVFGLTSQIRRAAVSIPSNIAEGRSRRTRKDFGQFLAIAYGSAAELETQLLIAKSLNYGDQSRYN
jgi:four helix bundle protein